MTRVLIALGVILLVAILVLAVYGACGISGSPTYLTCVRDVAIIVLAVESFVVTLLLLVVVLLFGRLISLIQDEIEPVLKSAQRTAHVVQGTTTFVADSLVAPLISLAGLGAGLRGVVSGLLARRKKPKE